MSNRQTAVSISPRDVGRISHESGYTMPKGNFKNNLFSCCQNQTLCCMTLWCSWITYGRLENRLAENRKHGQVKFYIFIVGTILSAAYSVIINTTDLGKTFPLGMEIFRGVSTAFGLAMVVFIVQLFSAARREKQAESAVLSDFFSSLCCSAQELK